MKAIKENGPERFLSLAKLNGKVRKENNPKKGITLRFGDLMIFLNRTKK